MEVYLIRHGKTKGNEQKRYIGSTEESLSSAGKQQLFTYLSQGIYPQTDTLYLSPMIRCVESGNLIFPKADFKICPALRECDFGEFEGKTYDELCQRQDYQLWIEGKGDPKGGESLLAFKSRVVLGFKMILKEAMDKGESKVVILLHGGSIMAILEWITERPDSFYEFQTENGKGYQLLLSEDGKTCIKTRKF